MEGIKPCTLANTGLLVATLMRRGAGAGGGGVPAAGEGKGGEDQGKEEEDEEEEVARVNLVVQVANVDFARGKLVRVIYSPLE